MALKTGVSSLNPHAEYARASETLGINVHAARSLMEIMKHSFGPTGTQKMLISGAGDITITRDGSVLLKEMQIQHPTASLIARAVSAQENTLGDGTISVVLMIGELMRQAEMYLTEGMQVRNFHSGIVEVRRELVDKAMNELKIPVPPEKLAQILDQVVRTSVSTKLPSKIASHLSGIISEAIQIVKDSDDFCDIKMIEILEMHQQGDMDTRLVRGLVLDHGTRHPDMPHRARNAYILTCNITFEFEKTEVNSEFFYKSAEDRERLVASEREYILMRVKKIIELKNKLCTGSRKENGFVVITQRGIDPFSLDLFARAGIMAIRRAKKRNMERIERACGGKAILNIEDLNEDCLGFAGLVYEHVIGDDKYTFIEECDKPKSVTILIKGPQKYIIKQIKEACRDGMKSAQNLLREKFVVPGAGAFELALSLKLTEQKNAISASHRTSLQAIADFLLIVPKTIIQNSGLDPMQTLITIEKAYRATGVPMGVDVKTGLPIDPAENGILDCFTVKSNCIHAALAITSNLLMVDEILRAGVSAKGDVKKGGHGMDGEGHC